MDEEDGRLGPRARKFGPFDVLRDALVGSLRQPSPVPLPTSFYSDSFALNHLQMNSRMIHLNPPTCSTAPLFLCATSAEGDGPAAGKGEVP
jgi:hypothetical protein